MQIQQSVLGQEAKGQGAKAAGIPHAMPLRVPSHLMLLLLEGVCCIKIKNLASQAGQRTSWPAGKPFGIRFPFVATQRAHIQAAIASVHKLQCGRQTEMRMRASGEQRGCPSSRVERD